MICSDGAQMGRQIERAGRFRLSYQRCPICGRCDGWTLETGDETLRGQDARQTFNRLRAGAGRAA